MQLYIFLSLIFFVRFIFIIIFTILLFSSEFLHSSLLFYYCLVIRVSYKKSSLGFHSCDFIAIDFYIILDFLPGKDKYSHVHAFFLSQITLKVHGIYSVCVMYTHFFTWWLSCVFNCLWLYWKHCSFCLHFLNWVLLGIYRTFIE